MRFRIVLLVAVTLLLSSCVSQPPADVNNVCHIFKQYPRWYREAKDVEKRWKVPVHVQMAIIHQESKFNAHAKPARRQILGIIPWKRPSTAYGYTQALSTTWDLYKRSQGWMWSSREDFADGVDFIGWYANQAYVKARIPRHDAYSLYLAYHEGVGGYLHKTYLRKSWLLVVARKVRARAAIYEMQLKRCSI
jgi:hypothetical protein